MVREFFSPQEQRELVDAGFPSVPPPRLNSGILPADRWNPRVWLRRLARFLSNWLYAHTAAEKQELQRQHVRVLAVGRARRICSAPDGRARQAETDARDAGTWLAPSAEVVALADELVREYEARLQAEVGLSR